MKADYIPDSWVIVKIKRVDVKPVYRILAGWYGGYINADSWRLSSGVSKVKDFGKYYRIENYSGSIYDCFKDDNKLTVLTESIFKNLGIGNDELTEISICEVSEMELDL